MRGAAGSLRSGAIRVDRARAKSIFLSPDGQLGLLPLGALLRDDGRFVLEETPLVYVGSGRDLLEEEAPAFSPQLTVYAVPLAPDESSSPSASPSATTAEALRLEELARQAGWAVSTYVGADATEDRLRAQPPAGILHLATHGDYIEDIDLDRISWTLRDPMLRGFAVL